MNLTGEVRLMTNLHPGLMLIFTGIILLIVPEKLRKWISLGGAALAFIAVILLNPDSSLNYGFSDTITMELLHVDRLSWFFGLIFGVISVIAGVYAFDDGPRGEKCASLIYAGSSFGVVFAGDWITLISFWEVMAVSSCYLVWAGGTHRSRRASYRYIVMHFFGGNLLLAGAVMLMAGGTVEVESLTGLTGAGYWLVFLGVAVNGAIPPLHTWVADAYPESTPAGTVYMGSFTTKVAIYALIRLFAGTEALVFIGALMAVLAACMALIENDLRRLLSYHIVSQLGMMVAALGTGTAAGIDGAALHAAFNILYKGVLLMGAGAVISATGKRKISYLGGLAKKMPVTAGCFLIASLSIAGMPFLNGFASKALIMEGLHQGHWMTSYWLIMLAGIGTWLSITLKINYFVFFGKTDKDVECSAVPRHMELAMVMGTILCIVSGIFPDVFYGLAPHGTMGHPFTMEHILEYAGLFIGGTVPFAVFLKKMAPHDMLTLDFDWFYRRPLASAVFSLSKLVHRIFSAIEDSRGHFLQGSKVLLRRLGRIFFRIEHIHEEENMPVGSFMQVFLIFCVIAFLIVLIIR